MPRQRSPEPSLVTLQRTSGSADSGSLSDSDDDDTYVVEAVLKRRVDADGEWEYLVKWEGYTGDEATTWEPEENLNCSTLLHDFIKAEDQRKKEKERKELQEKQKASVRLELGSSSEEEEAPRPKLPAKKVKDSKGKSKAVDEKPAKKPKAAVNATTPTTKATATKPAKKITKSVEKAPASTKKRLREDSPPPRRKPTPKKKTIPLAVDSSSDSEDAGAVSSAKQPVASSNNIKRPVPSPSKADSNRRPSSSAPAPTPNHSRPSFMGSAPSKLNGLPSFRKIVKPTELPAAADDGEDEVEIGVEPYARQRPQQSSSRDPVPSTSDSRPPNDISINGQPSLDRKPSAPRPRSSGPFSMPGSAGRVMGVASQGKVSRVPASVISRLRNGADAEIAAVLKEEVDRELERLKQEEAKKQADDRVKQKATAQTRISDLEGRLRGTTLYANNRALFEAKTLAVVSAELMGMDPALVLSMRRRFCTFIHAPPGNALHEAEHVALGLVLLANGAQGPASIAEIQVVFIHRAAPFEQVLHLLVALVTAETYVQMFVFGDGQPVARIFLQGYLIMPTLAALRQTEQLATFSRFLAHHPTSTLQVHPASIVLSHSALPQSWKTIADNVAADIRPSPDLPLTSKLIRYTTDDLLSPNDSSRTLPDITMNDELDEIEMHLTELRPAHPERHRRYVLVVDREGQDELESRFRDVGVEVMSWSGLTASMKEAIY